MNSIFPHMLRDISIINVMSVYSLFVSQMNQVTFILSAHDLIFFSLFWLYMWALQAYQLHTAGLNVAHVN